MAVVIFSWMQLDQMTIKQKVLKNLRIRDKNLMIGLISSNKGHTREGCGDHMTVT